MRSPAAMDTIQIELTDACTLACSNCTRNVGHRTPFFITFDEFKKAINSLRGFQGIAGFMGGEPTLHPQFSQFCEYALSVRPRELLGLWSVFPDAPKYKAYREVICKTFGNILLNDHTMDNIMHGPIHVGIEEVVTDKDEMWQMIDRCWVQNSWSASINQKGAYFCEVAAANALLYDRPDGWAVEPGWWKKTPKDFREQMEAACPKCGCALPLKRRASVEERDDISPENLKALDGKSKRVRDGKFVENHFEMDSKLDEKSAYYPEQVYKDEQYRKTIAKRYGIGLRLNKRGYWEPYLMSASEMNHQPPPSLYQILNAKYNPSPSEPVAS